MRCMREKYLNDPAYKNCVDTMTALIIDNRFTPSEMREMAVLASIRYEEINFRNVQYLNPEVEKAFKILREAQND